MFDGVTCLTFDCYGTLIDWDDGMRRAVRELSGLDGCDLERLLADRREADDELTASGYVSYDEVLRVSLRRAAAAQGREVSDAQAAAFAAGMGAWPPFPDSPPALARLKARYRLGILSNVRREVLEQSAALLGVAFDALVSAEEVRSYKPRRAHFDEGLRRLGAGAAEVLHVANSPHHDVAPACEMGWRCAWVNRRGLAPRADLAPTVVTSTLADLADILGCWARRASLHQLALDRQPLEGVG